jgi:hypothetical protein
MERLFIKESEIDKNLLGFLELSTDEQIAKKIYEATGDKTFKGFLPFSWNTAQIVKMRDAMERLKAAGKLSVLNMGMQIPTVSQAAHQYFITNSEKIKGIIPQNFTPGDIFKPLKPVLFIAGLAAAAYLLSQAKTFIPKGQTI